MSLTCCPPWDPNPDQALGLFQVVTTETFKPLGKILSEFHDKSKISYIFDKNDEIGCLLLTLKNSFNLFDQLSK